jgi:alpha-galactosidase
MERKKIVLIGAGSAVFTKGLIADFIQSDFGKWEIALCDIDADILLAVEKLSKKMIEQKDADIVISSSINRVDLLPGADFVVVTIAVGGRRAWEQDVKIPRKYGIYQPVGDSVMPGGISRAQRMIPVMIKIAEDVKRYCPSAHFFSYSNPMTAVVTAVRKATGVELTGLCHGVIYGEKYLARMMNRDVNRITTIGVGLNHLTFLYDIRVDGQDAKRTLHEIVKRQRAEAVANGHTYDFFNSQLEDKEIPHFMNNPFSWELFDCYGALPAVVDRHAVEFFPERFPKGQYYGHVLGVDAFPIDDVIERGETTYRNMLRQGETENAVDAGLFERSDGEHEQLVEIIKSILLDERKIFSVNIPNAGAFKGLPDDAVLEIPGVATARGFSPIIVSGFDDRLKAITARKLASVSLTVEAALSGDRRLWEEAMLLDGAVTERSVATELVRDFYGEHGAYLPQYS